MNYYFVQSIFTYFIIGTAFSMNVHHANKILRGLKNESYKKIQESVRITKQYYELVFLL
jgi:hypothetical protein